MLNQMASYTNLGGGIQSLADLGVEFDGDTGQLSFNQTTFSALSQSQVQDALTFLGSTTSGFGAFYTQLDGFSDPVTGLIQSEISGDQQTDSDLQGQISTMQAQVSTLQTNLTAQLESADTQQEELQNQQAELNASLDGLNLVLYGKDTTAF
jgi:flagellar capping protein FliD